VPLPNHVAPPTLTVQEVAALLRIGRSSAYAAIRAGEIPSVRIGHRLLVPTAALLRLLEVNGSEDASPADRRMIDVRSDSDVAQLVAVRADDSTSGGGALAVIGTRARRHA
jgi:excisionase family DNA binding protein